MSTEAQLVPTEAQQVSNGGTHIMPTDAHHALTEEGQLRPQRLSTCPQVPTTCSKRLKPSP